MPWCCSNSSMDSTSRAMATHYIRLAQQFTDAATPQDNFLATIASDWRYERALQGIRLLAQHHLGHLVQALIAWRQNVNEDIKKNFSSNNVVNVQGVCKRAAMEILFLEAANQVLDEFVPKFWRERHFQTFFESMQHVSFRWLLNAEEYVPHQELALVRQHVVLVSSRIVGALSRIKLADVGAAFVKKLEERLNVRKDLGGRAADHITQRQQLLKLCTVCIMGALSRIKLADVGAAFVKKLEERLNVRKDLGGRAADHITQRQQLLKLCTGMHGIVLSFDNDSQLEASLRFLQKAHPLNYTAAIKKSQVHHALCEMLAAILIPLVRSNQPNSSSWLNPALLAEWHNQVLRLKNDIGQWANKHSKHIQVGYPLVTVLVCLVDAGNYSSLVDSMADFLTKQMKNKEYRSLCFKCLNQLVISSLVRKAGPSASPAVAAWLDKIVKPVLANARKGGISLAEQQDFVSDVADLSPEYCVGSILQDLLASDSPDAQLIALRTLHLVATSVPAGSAAALGVAAGLPRRSTALAGSCGSLQGMGRDGAGRRMVQLPAPQVLDLIRCGQHPFDLQDISHLLPRLQQQLGQLLAQYHRAYGSYLAFAADAVPKDKQPALVLFSWVVRLVPYLRPEQWAAVRPLDLLPSYTAHVEGAVRASAFDALMSTVRACPALRGAVLSNMAAFLGAIPDESTQTIRECLLLLGKLMEGWLALLQQQRLASSSLCSSARDSSSSSSRIEQQQQQQQQRSCDAGRTEQAQQQSWTSSKEAGAAAAGSAAAPGSSSSSGSSGLGLDVHRLDGVLFMLLCSCDEAIRGDALTLLGLTRLLHQELQALAQQMEVTLGAPAQQQQQQQQLGSAAAAGVAGAGASSSNNALAALSSSFASVASSLATAGVQDSVASMSLGAGGAGAAAVAASGGSGSGGGFFFKHKPTISRDSFELMQTLGQLETPDAGVTYVMDVLEEVGVDVARRCFWDFGDWSDLWRDTKHVPLDVTLQSVMAASDEVGGLRWMRCVVELARAACHMCPVSMGVAYMEMLHKLARYLSRDSSGRLTIPAESADGRRSDAWKAFVVVACVCPPSLWERVERAAARKGSALAARELIRALLASLTGGSAIPQQVTLMAVGHASPEHYPALFEELPALMEEYSRPGKQKRGNARPEEARKVVANIMRLVADAMAPGTLATQPQIRARLLDWMRDTTQYLRSLAPFGEAFWEVSQVAYCLCAVCRCVAGQLVSHLTLPLALLREIAAFQRASSSKSNASEAPGTPGSAAAAAAGVGSGAAAGDSSQHLQQQPQQGAVGSGGSRAAGQPMARKLLFEMFAAWCEEGTNRGAADYNARLGAGVHSAVSRFKDYDSDTRESLRQELVQSAELLDQAARLAMAAMLQGPVFDSDARRTAGPVLTWIDRLLQAPPLGISAGRIPAVPKDAVGRSALFQLLRSNLDMFPVCVDRCYYRDPRIAATSFQVVSEVYALHPVKVEPHVVLSLVLYKMVDSNPEVREDALHMLHVLSTREWQISAADMAAAAAADLGGGAGGWQQQQRQQQQQRDEVFALEAEGGSGTVVVLGALQDSYQQFQFQLAVKLARDHPELSEALCEEMMTRQLELADKVSQHPVLTCLGPWMENLTIAAHWKGTWCERLLKSMYYVTLRHGDELPLEIERLWATLAANRRNIIPMLDFLASLGTHMAYQELTSMLEYLGVSKRICLYLARISPQQTIDHLVYEISLQLHEEEPAGGNSGSSAAAAAAAAGGGLAGGAPLQFADVLACDAAVSCYQICQDPSAHAAAAAAAAAGDTPGMLRSSTSSCSRQQQQQQQPSDDGGWGAGGGQAAAAGGLGGGLGDGRRGRRGSRQVGREPPSPVLRGLVTRPELALCLLTEVAYEHDEDFSSHLALLCHSCLLLVDHEEALVAGAAAQLLVHVLYSLSARQLELRQEEGGHVECLQATHLIKYLQSMKGRRLWAYEDLALGQQQQLPSATALAGMVQHCLDALSFEPGLGEAWVGVSLEWALHAHNRHLACRSQQVLRALAPPLTADMCSTLLACLQQCLAAADASHVAREVALELLLTLRSLVEALPARKLLLYPQVFWSSLLLCFTSYVHIYQQALILLQLGQLEPGSELLEALQECMVTLSAACSSQGLHELENLC
ncbi:hypothetical protein OEZ86_013510 [Tetradesmus obliquus]|nr:hypothetical protein OEZ86_013510 [Tetradesmus obliquus]